MSTHAYNINIDLITVNDNFEEMDIQYCGGTLGIKYNGTLDTLSEVYLSLNEIWLLRNFFSHIYKCEKEIENVNANRV
jgi:hypothetical protein|tara:strand:+ start:58 stop:291 length:234 start_codon:yes stop_codon:yes gene_type:complete